jgi:hypothetical protein
LMTAISSGVSMVSPLLVLLNAGIRNCYSSNAEQIKFRIEDGQRGVENPRIPAAHSPAPGCSRWVQALIRSGPREALERASSLFLPPGSESRFGSTRPGRSPLHNWVWGRQRHSGFLEPRSAPGEASGFGPPAEPIITMVLTGHLRCTMTRTGRPSSPRESWSRC